MDYWYINYAPDGCVGVFACLDIHRWDMIIHGYAAFGWLCHWDKQIYEYGIYL